MTKKGFLQCLMEKCIHQFFYTRLIRQSGRGGAGAYPSSHRGTSCTGRQSITGPHRDKQDKQPHTLIVLGTILESPINLTCMFLDGGRKPEYPERTHAIRRTCKLHTERPQVGIEPGTLLLWGDGANHHTTVQPGKMHIWANLQTLWKHSLYYLFEQYLLLI